MSDPADKSDDLIAELAKLMATPPSGGGAVQPVTRPAPLGVTPTSAAPSAPVPSVAPTPFRIPGMDAPRPASAAEAPRPVTPAPQPEPRAATTGSIRIPGMDQPAPVSTSAPVSKFDFGSKPAMAPIKHEPLSSFADRLSAGQALASEPPPAQPMTPIRIPSDLKPVSENRSFAQGPALSVARPAPTPTVAPTPVAAPPAPVQTAPEPEAPGDDFDFDFGFGENPPASPAPVRAVQSPRPAAPAPVDPIAALIEADLADHVDDDQPVEDAGHDARFAQPEAVEDDPFEEIEEPQVAPPPEPRRAAPAPVVPVIRSVGATQMQPRPAMAPMSSAPQRQASNPPIPLKPVSVSPRSPEQDRFAISPGVGLNMRPPASQPLSPRAVEPRAPEPRAAAPQSHYDESDPMSEIENLIGEAVRVELTPGPVRVQMPQQVAPKVEFEPEADLAREIHTHPQPTYMPSQAPVVPPLTTSFAPRRANLKEDAATASAEDAILAAAAASGSEVGRLEPAVGDESPYRRLKVKPQRSSFLSGSMRQYVGMAVAGTLLLAAGLGLYWVLNMGRTANSVGTNAPQLTADATPIKAKPAASTAPATDSAKSPVLAKMDGASAAPGSEQLVSTDETKGTTPTRDVTTATADDGGESGLANRKVRTVTVRPDGTIVSGDDALAGGAELPVDRPNVPSVPSTETTNLLDDNATQVATADATTATPLDSGTTAAVAPTIDPSVVAPTPVSLPPRNATTGSLAPLSTKPLVAKPANTKVNAVASNGTLAPNGQIDLMGDSADPLVAKTTTATKPAAATTRTAAPAATGGTAAAYVQLSSQPTEADARAAMKTATARYGSLFGGNQLTIQQVDLGQKGVKWRVRLPAASLTDAASICSQLKAQGGDCFATKG